MSKPPHANDKKRTKIYEEQEKRQKRGEIMRGNGTRNQRESFLIFCVGKNTERDYFEYFKTPTINIACPEDAVGKDPLTMVKCVLECLPTYQAKHKEKHNGEEYQHVWIVFDKDDFSPDNFNGAINKANANGIKVAWSNQAFEYWFILHFIDHQGGGLKRAGYSNLINQHIGKYGERYDQNSKKVSRKMFDILAAINPRDNANPKRTFRQLTYQRAKSIYEQHQDDKNTPAMSESCTSVFELVALLDTSTAKDNVGKYS